MRLKQSGLVLFWQQCCVRFILCSFEYNKMNSRRVWTQQEDQCIVKLVQLYGIKNWAQVAIDLFKRFGCPKRSGKQCRQRWHNHLSPHIQKKTWTRAEEEKMFQLQKIHGNKWTVIAASLPGRTDNAIKNYFYSRVRRSLRRMGKFVGSKNSTQTMKHLKPSTLSRIFAAESELPQFEGLNLDEQKLISYVRENCETVRNEIIKFTNYKPKRNEKAAEAEKTSFLGVLEKLAYINETYEKIKTFQKRMRSEELMFQRASSKLILSDDSSQEENQLNSDQEAPSIQHYQPQKDRKVNSNERNQERSQKQSKNFEMVSNLRNDIEKTSIQPTKNSPLMLPTVILQSHFPSSPIYHQLQSQSQPQNPSQLQIPEFLIQLQEEQCVPNPQNINKYTFNIQSPGCFFNTPTNNPFCFFESPITPKAQDQYSKILQGFRGLQNASTDEFEISAIQLKKNIEQNIGKEQPPSQEINSNAKNAQKCGFSHYYLS